MFDFNLAEHLNLPKGYVWLTEIFNDHAVYEDSLQITICTSYAPDGKEAFMVSLSRANKYNSHLSPVLKRNIPTLDEAKAYAVKVMNAIIGVMSNE